jgi:hypothetical protein
MPTAELQFFDPDTMGDLVFAAAFVPGDPGGDSTAAVSAPAFLDSEQPSRPRKKQRLATPSTSTERPHTREPLLPVGDTRAVDVLPPKQLCNMGSFGSYLSHYRGSHSMADHNDELEPSLELERASGHSERTSNLLADLQQRNLSLSICPPDAYNYAVYMNQAAASATTHQINYMFVQQQFLLRDPRTGSIMITIDPDVAARAEMHGFTRELFDEVKNLAELEQLIATHDSLQNDARDLLQEDADDALRQLNAAFDDAASPGVESSISIPAKLSSSFRTDVMGNGKVSAFWPPLQAAMEQDFQWNEETYSALCKWSPEECKIRWQTQPNERDRWEQALMEMRQVYIILKRIDCGQGELVWGADESMKDELSCPVRRGSLSFTSMRQHAKKYAKSAGRVLDYFGICETLCNM